MRSRAQLDEVVDYYSSVEEFVFDVETTGKKRGNPKVNRVLWLGLCHDTRTDVIPLGHPRGYLIEPEHSVKVPFWDENKVGKRGKPLKQWRTERIPAKFTSAPKQLWPGDVFEALRPVFFGDAVKIGHNVKFDLLSIAKYYGEALPPPPYRDSMIAAFLLNSNLRAGLKKVVERLFEHHYDQGDIAKPDKNGENGIEIHCFAKAARYTALDVRYTWILDALFGSLLEEARLSNVMRLEMDVLESILPGALRGIRVDQEAMVALGRELSEEKIEIEKRIFSASGKVWDLDSAPQRREFVYKIRGHEPFAWTKGGKDGKNPLPSTSAGVLEAIASEDPVIAELLDYALVQKLRSTYTGGVEEDGTYAGGLFDHLVNGRIHTDLNQIGAATGRFSSRNPNLQNIPARSDDSRSKALRQMFLADEGCVLIVADYGQIEYRVLAELSGDPTLLKAFAEGWDPHAATIALLLGKDIEDVTSQERDAGKGTNFAEIYGAGPGKIASMAGVSITRAKWIKKEYQRRFPKVQEFKREVVNVARNRQPPYVTTLIGRRRYLPGLWSKADDVRFAAERQAVNTRVQGTAADIIKVAMVKLHRALPEGSTMVLQVHDELLVSAPEDDAEEVRDIVQETMESVRLLKRVKLEAEAKIGQTWAEAK